MNWFRKPAPEFTPTLAAAQIAAAREEGRVWSLTHSLNERPESPYNPCMTPWSRALYDAWADGRAVGRSMRIDDLRQVCGEQTATA